MNDTEMGSGPDEATPAGATVLFGDDANFSLYMPAYPASHQQLSNYIARLAGKVDILAWDCLVNGVCWFRSAVGPNVLQGRDLYPDFPGKLLAENIQALAAAGANPPLAVARECHVHGMKMLASVRMGLTMLDEREALAGSGIFLNAHMTDAFYNRTIKNLELSLEHEKARLDNSGRNLDFTFPEVRNLILDPCRELAESFPIDGFHLNFIRAGVPFESHQAAAKAPIMTGLLAQLRGLLDDAAARRQTQRLRLAVRVPNDLAFCGRMGLDVRAWVEQGLVDIIIPDQVHRMIFDARIDAFVALARESGIPVLPSLHPQPQPFGAPPGESRAVFRAGLDNWYRQGAHGFSTFNLELFHPHDGYTLDWFDEFRQPARVAAGERIFPVMAHTVPQNDLYVIEPATVAFRRHETDVRKAVAFPRILALGESSTGAILSFRVSDWSGDDELAVDIDGQRLEGLESRYCVHPAFTALAASRQSPPQHLDQRALSAWEWNTWDFTVSLEGLDLSSGPPAEIGFTLLQRPDILKELVIKDVQVMLREE